MLRRQSSALSLSSRIMMPWWLHVPAPFISHYLKTAAVIHLPQQCFLHWFKSSLAHHLWMWCLFQASKTFDYLSIYFLTKSFFSVQLLAFHMAFNLLPGIHPIITCCFVVLSCPTWWGWFPRHMRVLTHNTKRVRLGGLCRQFFLIC